MRVLVLVLCSAIACGGARGGARHDGAHPDRAHADRALARATTILERDTALLPDPRVMTVLAIAYERAGRLDDAERLANRIDRHGLPDPLLAHLTTLDLRIAAARRGEPPAADPALRDAVIRWADDLERHRRQLISGTVRERD